MSDGIRNRWEHTQFSAWQIGYQQQGSSIPYVNPYNPETELEWYLDWNDGAKASITEDLLMPQHITVHHRNLRSAQGFGGNFREK